MALHSTLNLIFVHGWGYDRHFWSGLVSALSSFTHDYIDFGYLGEDEQTKIAREGIFVTHSMGTIWALKHHKDKMTGLVAINGFANFQNFFEARVLAAMQKRLEKSPEKQMHSFWAQCGCMPDYKSLNQGALAQGLDFLAVEDQSAALVDIHVPVLSMFSKDDKIVNAKCMKDEWRGFEQNVFAKGGHVLPISKTADCAEAIEGFIRAKI